jgi:secretin/TonB-like protein
MRAIGSYGADARTATDWKTIERSWGQRHLAWICSLLVIAGICAAFAEERRAVTASEPIGFHIPSQSLAEALQAYGQRTGVQVLYESNSASGRRSAAVEGNFTAEQALNLLLAGTDLKVQYTRPDAITLALRSATTDRPPVSPLGSVDLSLGTLRVRASGDGDDVGRLHDYTAGLQIDIQKALQKNVRTRGGNYRAVLDLWIDRSRTVQRTEVFKSTGDVERDTAVASVLHGLTITRQAPANTPQPVRIVIVVKPLQ